MRGTRAAREGIARRAMRKSIALLELDESLLSVMFADRLR